MIPSREERISAIFKSYREDLPNRMHELESLWQKLKNSWDMPTAVEFDCACHAIAGSAPTFDLPEIGEAARAIEIDIKSILRGDIEISSAMINTIDVKMNALRRTLSAMPHE